MATETREWTQASADTMAATTGRKLWVEDGTVGHYADIGIAESTSMLLADYAVGYDAGDAREVEVSWRLYEDGEEVDCGAYSFAAH